MIEREKFKKYMTELKSLQENSRQISKALKVLSNDNEFFLEKPIEIVFNMLVDTTNDQYGNISYFIYELNWGEKAKENSITDENGKNIPMFTLDDLYNKLEEDEKQRCKHS